MASTAALFFLVLFGFQPMIVGAPSVTESSLDVLQYTTSGPESQASAENTGNGLATRPIDKGLKPLYTMTNEFLDLIHPTSKGDWIDDPRFDEAFRDGNIIAGVGVIYELIQNDWKFWAGHYLGFTIVIALGITFIVAMPIVGFVFCCCRLRGGCGAKPRHAKKNSDGLKRILLAILLLIFVTLMTAGVVCMFMTNEVLRQQTSTSQNSFYEEAGLSPEMGLLPSIVASLRGLQRYISQTFKDVKSAIVAPISDRVTIVRRQLIEFSERTREKLQKLLDPERISSAASSLSASLKDIASDLGLIRDYMNKLSEIQLLLNSSLMQSKMNILNALPSQCSGDCNQLRNKINNLNVTVDFSQSENAALRVENIRSTIDSDFLMYIEEGKMQLINMSDAMLNRTRDAVGEKVSTFLSEFDKKSQGFTKNGGRMVDEISREIDKALGLNKTIEFLMKTAPRPLETVGNFRYYVGIGLSCTLLLIFICVYLGLCFGMCGEAEGEDARFCNRGVGASFLLAGIGFTFVFASLLMSVAILLFVFGGASYTEICRPAFNQEDKAIVKVGERILASSLSNTRFNFTIMSVLSQCEDDKAIFEALNLGESLDMTKELENLQRLITESVNDLSGKIKLNFTSVVVAKQEILDMLLRLQLVSVNDFQFPSFESTLSRPATNANVTSLADELLRFSNGGFLNATQKSAMARESVRLHNISEALIGPLMNKTTQFRDFLVTFKVKFVSRPGFSTFGEKALDLTESLTNIQEYIRTNLSGLISDYMIGYIDGISRNSITFFGDLKHNIQHNVGKCRPLYNIFRAATVSTCGWFLNPFNGFWFSIMWCLLLSIPSLVLSVHLIGLYRRAEEYVGNDSKSLDDPSQSLLRKGFNRTANA